MEIVYAQEALDDLRFWKESGNKRIQAKISGLLQSIVQDPFNGIGKPEPLKYQHSGKWSRRINDEHRIVYRVADDQIFILALRGHYK